MLKKERNSIRDSRFELSVLDTPDSFSALCGFDCGDDDLNEFFSKDALPHNEQFLAKTYAFRIRAFGEDYPPAALICFFNDSIILSDQEKQKSTFERYLKRRIPHAKRGYKAYPAVKIGRLGIQKEWQRQGIGTHLLNMTKELFIFENRTGCRFLTVDAYNKSHILAFYKKNNFDFLSTKDEKNRTRIMFFDLKSLVGGGLAGSA
jgi:GNAT superfamily N-acetyltransferase